jgi:tetratricopeptide (TPR) repeat protein
MTRNTQTHDRRGPAARSRALSSGLLAACLAAGSACTVVPDSAGNEPAPHARTSSVSVGQPASASAALVQPRSPATNADVDAIWNDPIFKRQFIAGYGINAEIEPRVTQEEVAILEAIMPLMAEDLPGAESALQEDMEPNCSAILDFTLGGIQFQQDRLPEALENYRNAVAKFPSFRRAWRNLGLIYTRTSDFDGAIAAFTRMLELGGGDAYAYGLLGFSYAAKEDYQPAEVSYRNALLLQPENTEWRLGLTRCVFKQQKFEDAVALLAVLIARTPEKPDYWLLQAHAYMGLKQPLQAAENFEVLDRLGAAKAENLHMLGDIYASESLVDAAAQAYRRAIDLDAGAAQPQLARSLRCVEVLLSSGATVQAREITAHLRQVWTQDMPESDRRHLLKLEARLSMAEGDSSPEAVAVLEEILELDPLDGEALMMLGDHCSRQNEPDRAIFYFERAESLEAFESKAKVRHAQVLVSLGRYSEAIPLLRRAQEIKPRDEVARYIEQVERVARTRSGR